MPEYHRWMRSRVVLVAVLLASACSSSPTTPVAEIEPSSTSAPPPSAPSAVTEPITATTDIAPTAPASTVEPTTTVPAIRRLTGSITLIDRVRGEWNNCQGSGEFSDVAAGMQIVVRDGVGTILATTAAANLSDVDASGPWQTEHAAVSGGSGMISLRCILKFDTEVPEAEFYEIFVGERIDAIYLQADLDATGWHLALQIS